MTLGLSMWSVLDDQERVALIGHELAHQLNGDLRRNLFVHGAVSSLTRWEYVLSPVMAGSLRNRRSMAVIGEWLMVVLLLPISLAAGAFARALDVLANRQGLSAEYYADLLGARVAGTQAGARLAEKLLIAQACSDKVIHTAKFDRAADPWQVVAAYAAQIPPHEWERQRRLGRLRLPAIDSSHPPSQLRADLIRLRDHVEPVVQVSSDDAARIDAELAKPAAWVTKRLHERFPY